MYLSMGAGAFLAMLCCAVFDSVLGAKILAVFPFPGPSQYILVQPYLRTLAARGHEVTVINAFPQKTKVPNFHDLLVMEVHHTYDEVVLGAMEPRNKWQELTFFSEFFANISQNVLENPEVQQLLHSDQKFDLVIVEPILTDALFGFAQHFDAALIGSSSFGADAYIDELMGNISPVSYVPQVTSHMTDRMTFSERMENFKMFYMTYVHDHLVSLPHQRQIYDKSFPNAKVSMMDMRKKFSLMLLNQHFSLSFPRPYVPNMIEVGGMHINHKPTPLPKEMADFVDGAKDGVIYLSMGSNIKGQDYPPNAIPVLLKTFASLPQRVLWKLENVNLTEVPENVFISKWFPQPDILAHPKVKLFITHGGLLSTIETIYHGKPIIGMPVFYDQFLNVNRAMSMGIAVKLDFNALTGEDLSAAIASVLQTPSFSKISRQMSERYHDQPVKPLDWAIYWTEYVLRHNGAPHMQVAALDLSFIQLHSLDVIGVLLGAVALVLGIIALVFLKLYKVIRGGTKSSQKVKHKTH